MTASAPIEWRCAGRHKRYDAPCGKLLGKFPSPPPAGSAIKCTWCHTINVYRPAPAEAPRKEAAAR